MGKLIIIIKLSEDEEGAAGDYGYDTNDEGI